jgi:hypothetical protein
VCVSVLLCDQLVVFLVDILFTCIVIQSTFNDDIIRISLSRCKINRLQAEGMKKVTLLK